MQPNLPLESVENPQTEIPQESHVPVTKTPTRVIRWLSSPAMKIGIVAFFIIGALILFLNISNKPKTTMNQDSDREDLDYFTPYDPSQKTMPSPLASPMLYTPQPGWEVLDIEVSPDGKQVAVVIGTKFDNGSGYMTATEKSVSRLILYNLDTKEEKLLLERPILLREDIMDGPGPMYEINDVTWIPSRNSLIFTSHDNIEEFSLTDASIKTHFTFPKDGVNYNKWEAFFGLYEPHYWPQINAVTFTQAIWEGQQTWVVPLDQGSNTTGIVVARPAYEGPELVTMWGADFVINEPCAEGNSDNPEDWNCRKISLKSFPTLKETASIRIPAWSNGIEIKATDTFLIIAYGLPESNLYNSIGIDHVGRETQLWEILTSNTDTIVNVETHPKYALSLKAITKDLKILDITDHHIKYFTQKIAWELTDNNSTVTVRVLDARNQSKWPVLVSEERYPLPEGL